MLRKRARAKCACAFIYLLAIIGAYEGTALCFGADGHIRIELFEKDSSCRSFEKTAQEDSYRPETPRLFSEGNNCGPCVDLAFLSFTNNEQVVSKHNKSPKRQLAAIPALPHTVPTFALKATKGLSSNPQLFAYHTLASLRTVILIS